MNKYKGYLSLLKNQRLGISVVGLEHRTHDKEAGADRMPRFRCGVRPNCKSLMPNKGTYELEFR